MISIPDDRVRRIPNNDIPTFTSPIPAAAGQEDHALVDSPPAT